MKELNFDSIKESIKSTIKERDNTVEKHSGIMPSKFWKAASARTSYIFDLSSESLKDIRFHTYHLTSDLYQRYTVGNPDVLLQTGALNWDNWLGLSEPDSGMGFEYQHNGEVYKISTDLINTNRFLNLMINNNVLGFLTYERMPEIVEIGAGYGGLAYHLINISNRKIKYYIIDIPEVLLFSAIYFKVNMPEARMYLYNPGKTIPDNFNEYDVVLIPNHKADILKSLSNVKLIINIASFQEMTMLQVKDYIELVKAILAEDGCLFSWNMDNNPTCKEADLNVSEMLSNNFNAVPVRLPIVEKRFNLQEQTAKILRAAALAVKLMPQAPTPFYSLVEYKGYVCKLNIGDEAK